MKVTRNFSKLKVSDNVRVFLGVKDVSGVAWRVRCGLKSEGIACDLVNLYPYRHADKCSSDYPMPTLIKLAHKVTYALHIKQIEGVRRMLLVRLFLVLKVFIFLFCINRYDAFFYFGGVTLFSDSNLLNIIHFKILRLLNKKIVVFLLGSEVRPDYIDLFLSRLGAVQDNVEIKKKYLSLLEEYSDHIIAPSSCAQLLEKPIINLISLCLPHPTNDELGTLRPELPRSEEKRPVILHAPSELSVKGTSEIRCIIKELHAEGLEFDYLEISGVSRYQVLEAISKCDIVVDQMFSDVPMASFATEASFFGKPSVVGGGYSELIRSDVPLEYIPPSIYVAPEQFKKSLRRLIMDRGFRDEMSNQAWEYARNTASPQLVAQRLLRLLADDIPNEWLFDPSRLMYIYGFGLEKRCLSEILNSYIADYGVGALQLSNKPVLEKKILDLSGQAEMGTKDKARNL